VKWSLNSVFRLPEYSNDGCKCVILFHHINTNIQTITQTFTSTNYLLSVNLNRI